MNYPSSRNTYELESKLYNQEYIPYNSSRNVPNKVYTQRLSNSPPIILYKTENSKTSNNTHKYLFYPSISRLSPFTDGVTNYNIIENSNPRDNNYNNNSNKQFVINEMQFLNGDQNNENSEFNNQLGLPGANNNDGRKNSHRSISLGNNRNNRNNGYNGNNGNNRDNGKYQLMLDKSLEVLKTLTENMPEADAKIIGNSSYYIDKDKDYDAIVDKLKKYISFNFKKNSNEVNNDSKDGNNFNNTIGLNRSDWDKKMSNLSDNNNNRNPNDNYNNINNNNNLNDNYNNINNNNPNDNYNNINNNRNPNDNYNNINNNNPNDNYNNINNNRSPNDNYNNINNNRSPNYNYGNSTGNINSGNNFIKRNNDDNNNEMHPENEYINDKNKKYGDINDINYNPNNKKYNKTTNDEELGNNFANNNNFNNNNNNRGNSTFPNILNNGKGDNDNNNNRNYINDYNNSQNNNINDDIPTISAKKSTFLMNDNSHNDSQSNINNTDNPLIGTKNLLDINDNINNANDDDYNQQLKNDFTERQTGFGKNGNLPNNSNVRESNKNNLDTGDKNINNLNNTRNNNNNDSNIINVDNNKDNLNIDSNKGKTNFNPYMSDLSTKDHFNTNDILKGRKPNPLNQPLSQTSQMQKPNNSNSQIMQGNIIDNKFPATNNESNGINNNKTSNNINNNIDNNLEDNKDNDNKYELLDDKKKQILSEYGKPFIGEEVKEQYEKDNKKYVITKSGANIKLSVLHGIEGEPLVHSGYPLLGKNNKFYIDKNGNPILLPNENYIEGDKPISVTIKKGTNTNNELYNTNKGMFDSFGFNSANNIDFPNTVNTLRLDPGQNDNINLGGTYQSNNFYNIGIGGGGKSELKKSRIYKNRIKMFPPGNGDAKPPIKKKIKRKLKKK